MKVLGISLGHDTNFALAVDGVLQGIFEAERYFRYKRYKLICITLEPGKHISGNQYVDIDELKEYLEIVGKSWGKTYDAIAVQNQGRMGEYQNLLLLLEEAGFKYGNIYNVAHHLSHAAQAFYTSPFEEAVILSYDGSGNDGYTMIFHGTASGGLKYIEDNKIQFGRNYNNVGYVVGIKPEICGTTAGKLMGLAGYGELRKDWLSQTTRYVRQYRKLEMRQVVGLNTFGKAHRINSMGLDKIPDFAQFVFPADRVPPMNVWQRLKQMGTPMPCEVRLPGPENKLSQSLAQTVQSVWADEVVKMLHPYRKLSKHLCIVGGCALNGITNYALQESGMFDKIHLVPNPSDCGLSAGVALYVEYKYGGATFRGYGRYYSPYLGQEPFDMADLPSLKARFPHREFEEEKITGTVAALIKEDYIVGVIRGRYENGPRALGNRSILCNPTNRDMKDIINSKVKHREWYRPFAPVVAAENAGKYFTCKDEIPYMSVICYTRPEYRQVLPSITHVDGSARVQTVTRDQNEFLYNLTKEFEKLSGFPILLNTSFNPRGEPILNYCHVGLEMLNTTDLDLVLIGNVLFCKKGREQILDAGLKAPTR